MVNSTGNASPAYVAVPESGHGPGIVVLHAWWGLTDVFKRVCDRLAQQGFVAVAPDLYGGPTATTIEEAEQLVERSDSALMKERVLSAVDDLRSHPAVQSGSIGVLGFSMGAAWALAVSALRPDAVSAVVLFYGAGEADFSQARAAYQGHFVQDDPWEPIEYMQAMESSMRGAGRDVSIFTYEGVSHWFFEENRPEYDPDAAALAWERACAFFHEQLDRAR